MLEIKKVCYERGNILAIIRESIKRIFTAIFYFSKGMVK